MKTRKALQEEIDELNKLVERKSQIIQMTTQAKNKVEADLLLALSVIEQYRQKENPGQAGESLKH